MGAFLHRTKDPFSAAEAEEFVRKARILQEREQIDRAVLFVFSRKGFTKSALTFLAEHQIAYSDNERWLRE